MAKHVWLRKPTGSMTNDIFNGFGYALSIGATPHQAACATGYMMERVTQDSGRRCDHRLIQSTASTGYKIMKGVNKDTYPLIVMNHKEYLTKLCIERLELLPDTHWNIAMDYAQDSGNKVIYYLLGWLNNVDVEFTPLGTPPEKKKKKERTPYMPKSKYKVGDRVWMEGWVRVVLPDGTIRSRTVAEEYEVVGHPNPNTRFNVNVRSVRRQQEFPTWDERLFDTSVECEEWIRKHRTN